MFGCFDGGTITSDAGALLLREIDQACNLFEQFSPSFVDGRDPRFVEHSVQELIAQRTIGICLGYEDLDDHDELRRDPLLATGCGKLDPTGSKRRNDRDCGIALAGKSTLNRLETFGVGKLHKQTYKKITYSEEAIDQFFVDSSEETRTVSNDWVSQYENRYFQLLHDKTRAIRPKTKVIVAQWLDGSIRILHRRKEVPYEEINPQVLHKMRAGKRLAEYLSMKA